MSTLQTREKILLIFRQHADPCKAKAMRAYMKEKFPFFGIPTPQRQALVKTVTGAISDWSELRELVESLYSDPHREAHYAALDLLSANSRRWHSEVIDLLEKLVLTHSWWDTVDRISSPLVWQALKLFPEQNHQPLRWIEHPNFWLQRTALLYQRTAKAETDPERLALFIDQTMDSREFFLCKAIGWALRQYGYTNPDWVRRFVVSHHSRLSALSVREGTRALPKAIHLRS